MARNGEVVPGSVLSRLAKNLPTTAIDTNKDVIIEVEI